MSDLRPDDLPSDITDSLRNELTSYYEAYGTIPPRRRWDILFGPEYEPVPENRWMNL